ncbi:MAG: caspase family protein [Bacteroidaceae bacterium]|nr:caspase family protein [Bacteroidaceae bacterium]
MKTKLKVMPSLLLLLMAALSLFSVETMAQQSHATIYVVKKQQSLAGGVPTITINDTQVGQMKKNQYYECTVHEGLVTVSVLYKDQHKDLDLQVVGGAKYYICAEIRMDATGGNVFFNLNKSKNASYGRTPQQADNMDVDVGSVKYTVNLIRLNDASGEQAVEKCKERLFADMTEYTGMPQAETMYAGNTPQQVVVPRQDMSAKAESKPVPKSDVDVNIPMAKTVSDNTFVLIIANENYEFVDDVQFALNDGETFREYCVKTLGVPERQVWLCKNASLGIIAGGVDKMVQAMNIFDGAKAIVYYCGHGIPDEKTGDAYIIPVDGRGTNTATCYSLNELYKTMASAKTSNVTYFMDACFTGANRDGSMLVAARGVAREAKKEVITGNTVVFSAASGDETAMPFKEKGHGLFTYFLLKKLQESKGSVTYGELAEYINTNVKKEAFLTNEKPQNPIVATSKEFVNKWKSVNIK